MSDDILKQNKIPGSEKLTRPEEIAALSKFLKHVREVQEEHTSLNPDDLEVPGRSTGRIPDIKTLPDQKLKLKDTSSIKKLDNTRLKIEDNFNPEVKNLEDTRLKIEDNSNPEIKSLENIRIGLENDKDNKLEDYQEKLDIDEKPNELSKYSDKLSVNKENNLEDKQEKLKVNKTISLENDKEKLKVNKSVSLENDKEKLKVETDNKLSNTRISLKNNNEVSLSDALEKIKINSENKLEDSKEQLKIDNNSLTLEDYIEKIKENKIDNLSNVKETIKIENISDLENYINKLKSGKEVNLETKKEKIENYTEIKNLDNTFIKIEVPEVPVLETYVDTLVDVDESKNNLSDYQEKLKTDDNISLNNYQEKLKFNDDITLDDHKEELKVDNNISLDNHKEELKKNEDISLDNRKEELKSNNDIDSLGNYKETIEISEVESLNDYKEEINVSEVESLDDHREEIKSNDDIPLEDYKETIKSNNEVSLEDYKETIKSNKETVLEDYRETIKVPEVESLEDHKDEIEVTKVESLEDLQVGIPEDSINNLKELLKDAKSLEGNELFNKIIHMLNNDDTKSSNGYNYNDLNGWGQKVAALVSAYLSSDSISLQSEKDFEQRLAEATSILQITETEKGYVSPLFDINAKESKNKIDSATKVTDIPGNESGYINPLYNSEAKENYDKIKNASELKDLFSSESGYTKAIYEEKTKEAFENLTKTPESLKDHHHDCKNGDGYGGVCLPQNTNPLSLYYGKGESVTNVTSVNTGENTLPPKNKSKVGDTSYLSDLVKDALKKEIPNYQLPSGGILSALDLNRFLRFAAEKTVGLTHLKGKARELLLNETLAALVLAREKVEEKFKTIRAKLPGTSKTGLLRKVRKKLSNASSTDDLIDQSVDDASEKINAGTTSGKISKALNKIFKKGKEAANKVNITNPLNYPVTVDGSTNSTEISTTTFEITNSRVEVLEDATTIQKLQAKSIHPYTYIDNNGKLEVSEATNFIGFKNKYLSGYGIQSTLRDLCNNTDISQISSVEQLYDVLKSDNSMITTPWKFTTGELNKYRSMSLSSTSYWEVTFEPFIHINMNGGYSFLPAIEEINVKNYIDHGIYTGYNKWIPFNSFELTRTKLETKSLPLFSGEITYPIGAEEINELRLTMIDDSFFSWREYFTKVMEVSTFNSVPHNKDYYSVDKKNEVFPTPVDRKSHCIALYKNVTFRINIYTMTPQYSQVRHFDLLCVLKDFSEEYIGEVDGNNSELQLTFSVVGEDPPEEESYEDKKKKIDSDTKKEDATAEVHDAKLKENTEKENQENNNKNNSSDNSKNSPEKPNEQKVVTDGKKVEDNDTTNENVVVTKTIPTAERDELTKDGEDHTLRDKFYDDTHPAEYESGTYEDGYDTRLLAQETTVNGEVTNQTYSISDYNYNGEAYGDNYVVTYDDFGMDDPETESGEQVFTIDATQVVTAKGDNPNSHITSNLLVQSPYVTYPGNDINLEDKLGITSELSNKSEEEIEETTKNSGLFSKLGNSVKIFAGNLAKKSETVDPSLAIDAAVISGAVYKNKLDTRSLEVKNNDSTDEDIAEVDPTEDISDNEES